MAERGGVVVEQATFHRWVIRLVPLLDKAFQRHKRPVGRRWRMDETYIKVRGSGNSCTARLIHVVRPSTSC